MGNRGNVVFVSGSTISPTIYLHWNGGPESVYAFLDELDRRKVRADGEYEAARFVQIVGEFLDHDEAGGLSLGIMAGPTEITPEALSKVRTDNSDNGFYIVDRTKTPREVRRFEGMIVSRDPFQWELRELTEEERHPTDPDNEDGACGWDDPKAIAKYSAEFQEFYLELHPKISQYG